MQSNQAVLKRGNIFKDQRETAIIKFEPVQKSLSEFGKRYDWEIAENKLL